MFTQILTVRASSAQPLVDLVQDWHRDQAGVAPGYQGGRVLADQAESGRFVLEIDFSSAEEAERNNARPETQAWARKLQEVAQGEPEYRNHEVAYATG